MDNITYINFCKILFIFAAIFISLLFCLFLLETTISPKIKRTIYENLNNLLSSFLMGYEHAPGELPKEQIANIMYMEATKLYKLYIQGNDYLMKEFFSPNDLLIKFLIKYPNNSKYFSEIKYEIIINSTNYPEKNSNKGKFSDTFNIVSFIVTIIGIIVTIMSFFPS